jgi:hypothetical protein
MALKLNEQAVVTQSFLNSAGEQGRLHYHRDAGFSGFSRQHGVPNFMQRIFDFQA